MITTCRTFHLYTSQNNMIGPRYVKGPLYIFRVERDMIESWVESEDLEREMETYPADEKLIKGPCERSIGGWEFHVLPYDDFRGTWAFC